jgi:hypothetical protein
VHVREDRHDGADLAGRLGSQCGRIEMFDHDLVDAVIGGKDPGAFGWVVWSQLPTP